MSSPLRIFQTWKSKTDIPDDFQYWSETWRACNPTYDYVLWDDADNRAFIAQHYPWFLERYDSYPAEIYRADAVRYFHLYHFGGVYADMDVECLCPVDQLMNLGGVVLGRMGTDETFDSSIPNAIMFSEPREEFWLVVISMLLDEDVGARPEIATGPNLLRRAFLLYQNEYLEETMGKRSVHLRMADIRTRMGPDLRAKTTKSMVRAIPGKYLYPVNWNDPVHDQLFRRPLLREKRRLSREEAVATFPESFTVTYWTHSWEPCDLS